ncbi:AraC family transcriptional regulator [Ktedonosporobacter rubrisoli]|nr:AraC family transcriptional regulator [Ktedonosporobacter rubrisoli]
MMEKTGFVEVQHKNFWSPTVADLHQAEKASWEHLHTEYHRHAPPGTCQRYYQQHRVRVALQNIVVERRIDAGPLTRHRLTAGDLFISPAGSQEWLRRYEYEDFFTINLEPALLTRLAEASGRASAFELLRQKQAIQDPLLLQISHTLRAESKVAGPGFSSIYVQELSHAFAAHLLRHYGRWEEYDYSTHTSLSTSRLRRIIDYIHSNLAQPLTLTELAALVAMNPYHFTRIFKRTTGVSPHQYILSQRIEQARRLLLKGELSQTQIANQLGFYDQSHFSRTFKRVIGLTPQAYCQEHVKNIQD